MEDGDGSGRMDDLISSYYADGTKIDAVMCSNDSTALGVENSLAQNYNGEISRSSQARIAISRTSRT